ncbi:MAG: substrate-binding periplasmic protein [Cellvibrionaceae bacterium]
MKLPSSSIKRSVAIDRCVYTVFLLFFVVVTIISSRSFANSSANLLTNSTFEKTHLTKGAEHSLDKPVLRIFADDWQGYSGIDGTGLYFDIIRAVFENEAVVLEFVYQPVRRGIELMRRKQGNAVVGLWHHRYSTDSYITGGLPLDVEIVSAVFPVTSAWTWQRLREEQDARYAWVKGYGYGPELDLPRQARVPSSVNGLRMLEKNHIDGFIDDLFYVSKVIDQTPEFDRKDYRIEPILTRNMYLAFRPDAQGQYWLEIYRKNMEMLLREGRLHRLFEEWGLDYEKVRYRELDRY